MFSAVRDSWGAHLQHQADRAIMAARFARDVPRFVQATESLDGARLNIRTRLQQRGPRFQSVVRRAIFEHPASPYLPLFRHAGCEYGDLVRLVDHEGVEGALTHLAARGVYVTFDETTGRREIVRGSFRRTFSDTDFDNPLAPPHFTSQTGGSSGRAKPLRQALSFGYEIGSDFAVTLNAHGVQDAAFVFWMAAPIFWLLMVPRLGHRTVGWYFPLQQMPWWFNAGARYLSALTLLGGARIPVPEHVDLTQAGQMARLLFDRLQRERPVVLCCPVSSSVRVALAAREAGLSLDGLVVIAMGEPTTEQRRSHIEASGARVMTRYSTMETGPIAAGCAAPTSADDSHVFLDRFALIDRPDPPRVGDAAVPSLLVSGLGKYDIKVLLNAELGDYGRREVRAATCCRLGELGLTTHLTDIRSFEKLSGEGVSFARSQIERIIEGVLPATFGGTALDYQLVEETGPDGNLRLALCVAPSCGDINPERLRAVFLAALAAGTAADRYQAALLDRAHALIIRRERPHVTSGGKMLPFHVRRT